MNNYIDRYLESKRYAWATTTLTSERHRLNAIRNQLDGNPETLWLSLANRAPYTRLTIWTRATDYIDWLIEEKLYEGPNSYKSWRKKNAKIFKNVYNPSKPSISYDQASKLIQTIGQDDIRRRALEILGSGLRYSEATQSEVGFVNGKGSKRRTSYRPKVEGPDYNRSYQTFRRALGKLGLTPHALRKLFLSRLVELGANEFQLCEIAGWNSISTASSYIKVNSEQTRRLVQQVQGVDTSGITEK